MEDCIIVINSTYNCLINVENKIIEIKNGQPIQVGLSCLPAIIEIFPTTQRTQLYFLPFKISLSNNNNFDKQYSFFYLQYNCYQLEIHPKIFATSNFSGNKLFDYENKQYKIKIFQDALTKIIVEEKNNKIEFCPKHYLQNIACSIKNIDKKDFFILSAKTTNDKTYIFIYPLCDDGKCLQKVNDDYFFDDQNLFTLDKLDKFTNHAIVNQFKIDCNGLYKTHSYSIRLSQKNLIESKNVNMAFFECIRAKDYELARSFLSPTLSQQIDSKHLEKFFEKFEKFYINPTNNNCICLVGENICYYKTTIINQKIENIEQI